MCAESFFTCMCASSSHLVQKVGVAAGPSTFTKGLAMPVAESAKLATYIRRYEEASSCP